MDNKVYYGEYSLKHWIDLILKENIILPEYQRHFVWAEGDVQTLIGTLKNKQFIPPVTIGAFDNAGSNQNLILDGQQRLTSILLAHLGLYPDKSAYKKPIEKYINENDEDIDEEDNEKLDNVIEWTFGTYINEKKKKREGHYKMVNYDINDDFLNKTFLGFSYLVPNASEKEKYLKFYSSVFRNINRQGIKLIPQESRKSLYYLNGELVKFFDPDLFKVFAIKNSGEIKADFVRYLSLLSHYKRCGNPNTVARGYKSYMEDYYEAYIYSVVDDEDSETYGKFSTYFPEKKYDDRFGHLQQAVKTLEIPTQFSSIIDLDMYVFGLIYHIVFENKVIKQDDKDNLKHDLESKIAEFRKDDSHTKSPSNLGHLRIRISSSIDIYKKYAS